MSHFSPTPAQIEAVVDVLRNCSGSYKLEAIAEMALTAAAEVGETNQQMLKRWDDGDAADKRDFYLATIERCAQVAEKVELNGKWIAAAIRKLKD